MKSLEHLHVLFLDYLKGIGYADSSIKNYASRVKTFIKYLHEVKRLDIRDIEKKDILSFIEYIREKETYRKKKIEDVSIYHLISGLRSFFGYLYRNEIILINPVEDIEISEGIKKEKQIFTKQEINTFLDCINIKEENGKRDRALFELIYSSGLRIGEVCGLDITDIDLKERILIVRGGKGGKDRYVPFSVTVQKFLNSYIDQRTKFLKRNRMIEEKALFLKTNGRITKDVIRKVFKRTLEISGIKRDGLTVHSIRHSTATHLLECGADLRYVAELLGHDNLQTTTVYTHLMLDNIKRVYKSSHPRENLYYTEVDEDYLKSIDDLIEGIKKRDEHNKKYAYLKQKKIDR